MTNFEIWIIWTSKISDILLDFLIDYNFSKNLVNFKHFDLSRNLNRVTVSNEMCQIPDIRLSNKIFFKNWQVPLLFNVTSTFNLTSTFFFNRNALVQYVWPMDSNHVNVYQRQLIKKQNHVSCAVRNRVKKNNVKAHLIGMTHLSMSQICLLSQGHHVMITTGKFSILLIKNLASAPL